jgi:hypothetical protein
VDWLAIVVIINNYLHDLATGLLLAAAVVMWVLIRRAVTRRPADIGTLARSLPTLNRFVAGALVWIVVGGIPRVIFFSRYEWDPAVVNGIVPALLVKHALMFAAVAVGAVMWRKATKALADAGKSAGAHAGDRTEDA